MRLGTQPDLTYVLLARVGGRRPIHRLSAAGAAGRPSQEPGPYPRGPGSPLFGDGRPVRSGGQREVLLIGCEARPDRVRPADPLKPG